jgi:hypothetical protein
VLGYGAMVAFGVDPCGGSLFGYTVEFGEHIEVTSVCAKKNIAGQAGERDKRVLEVRCDAGIGSGFAIACDEADSGIAGPSTDDDHVKGAVAVLRLHGPGGAASRVSRCLVRGEGGAAEDDSVVVVQRAIDVGGGKVWEGWIEVGLSSSLNHVDVALHDHVLRMRLSQDLRGTGGVIVVCLAVKKNLCIGPAKAEPFYAAANERGRRLKVGVDEDVALGRDDEICGKIARSDIVKVAGDVDGCKRSGPVSGDCVRRFETEGEEKSEDNEADTHADKITAVRIREIRGI